MSEVEKASKRHCWPTRPASEAYECGFEAGAIWQREKDEELILDLQVSGRNEDTINHALLLAVQAVRDQKSPAEQS